MWPGNFRTVGSSRALSFAVKRKAFQSAPGLPASQEADPSSTWAVKISMNSAPKSLKPLVVEAHVYITLSKTPNSAGHLFAINFEVTSFEKLGMDPLMPENPKGEMPLLYHKKTW